MEINEFTKESCLERLPTNREIIIQLVLVSRDTLSRIIDKIGLIWKVERCGLAFTHSYVKGISAPTKVLLHSIRAYNQIYAHHLNLTRYLAPFYACNVLCRTK